MLSTNRKTSLILLSCTLVYLTACQTKETKTEAAPVDQPKPAAISLSGRPLFAPEPSQKLLERYQKHRQNYQSDTTNADLLIWYGRFTAYKGDYDEAINLFTKGVKQFPSDPRFLRHRGHRYISVRKFDQAILDLEAAAGLIEGTENEIEPDGMPNAQNIPVSTLHGNIYYHLGLAYYLKHDFEKALSAYQKCLASSSNNDNLVSSTHWLYMISRRLGWEQEAKAYLTPISDTLKVIENSGYHRICLFYKGLFMEEELTQSDGNQAASDAVYYGLGNWYFYNGNEEKANEVFRKILARDSWNSFGFIAAEVEMEGSFQKY
ncbi:MAG: tetratricopeptide repeat protein [Cyclobacteriaceae bacterium]